MARKIINERIPLSVHSALGFGNNIDEIENPLDAVIASLISARDASKAAGYTNIRIVVAWGDYGEGCSLDLFGDRKETVKEAQRRIEKERKEKARKKKKQDKQDAKDRAEYARLKAKFEGKQTNE